MKRCIVFIVAAAVGCSESPLQARADLIIRYGEPVLRVSVDIDAPIGEARDQSRWGFDVGELFVFPSQADVDRSDSAVWLLAPIDSDRVEVSFNGEPATADIVQTDLLGEVVVASVQLGSTPLGNALDRFAIAYRAACNIDIVERAPTMRSIPGFSSFPRDTLAFIDLDTVDFVRDAAGETVFLLAHRSMRPLLDAINPTRESSVITVLVFDRIEDDETRALALSPVLFQSNRMEAMGFGSLYHRSEPIYSFESESLSDLQLEDPGDYHGMVFASAGATDSVGHELGHMLGLSHPPDTVIDAGSSPSGEPNLMEQGQQATHITPEQCEIMLTGFTGYLREPDRP